MMSIHKQHPWSVLFPGRQAAETADVQLLKIPLQQRSDSDGPELSQASFVRRISASLVSYRISSVNHDGLRFDRDEHSEDISMLLTMLCNPPPAGCAASQNSG